MNKRVLFLSSILIMASCLVSCNQEYEVKIGEGCDPTDYVAKCVEGNNQLLTACTADGLVTQVICRKGCENGACKVTCTDDDTSDCTIYAHSSPLCISGECSYQCDDGYVDVGNGCDKIQCEDANECTTPDIFATATCENHICGYYCDLSKGVIPNADGSGCEVSICARCDDLRPEPNAMTSKCVENKCKFECKEINNKKRYLDDDTETRCVDCNLDSHCGGNINNGEVHCQDHQCVVTCDPCYTAEGDSCKSSDVNNNNIPDCKETADCNDEKVICITSAEEFLRIPAILSNNDVKSQGKILSDATFYLVSSDDSTELDLTEVMSDDISKGGLGNISGLRLKTDMSRVWTIKYNGSLLHSLFDEIKNSTIENIKFELSVNTDRTVLAKTITDTQLNNVVWSGGISGNNMNSQVGFVGIAENSTLTDCACENAFITASKEAKDVGCLVGHLKDSSIKSSSNSSTSSQGVTVSGGQNVGGLIGRASGKISINNVAFEATSVSGNSETANVGGFIGKIEKESGKNIEISNITNTVDTVSGEHNEKVTSYVGGFVGSIQVNDINDTTTKISSVTNVLNSVMCKQQCAGFVAQANDVSISKITNQVKTVKNDSLIAGVGVDFGAAGFAFDLKDVTIEDVVNKVDSITATGLNGAGFVFQFSKDDGNASIKSVDNIIEKISVSRGGGFASRIVADEVSKVRNQVKEVTGASNFGGFSLEIYSNTSAKYSEIISYIQKLSSEKNSLTSINGFSGTFDGNQLSDIVNVTELFNNSNENDIMFGFSKVINVIQAENIVSYVLYSSPSGSEKDKILPQIGSCIPSGLKNMYYSYENINGTNNENVFTTANKNDCRIEQVPGGPFKEETDGETTSDGYTVKNLNAVLQELKEASVGDVIWRKSQDNKEDGTGAEFSLSGKTVRIPVFDLPTVSGNGPVSQD